jgi:hypothetical protein
VGLKQGEGSPRCGPFQLAPGAARVSACRDNLGSTEQRGDTDSVRSQITFVRGDENCFPVQHAFGRMHQDVRARTSLRATKRGILRDPLTATRTASPVLTAAPIATPWPASAMCTECHMQTVNGRSPRVLVTVRYSRPACPPGRGGRDLAGNPALGQAGGEPTRGGDASRIRRAVRDDHRAVQAKEYRATRAVGIERAARLASAPLASAAPILARRLQAYFAAGMGDIPRRLRVGFGSLPHGVRAINVSDAGKVCVDGIAKVAGRKVFVLRLPEARDPSLVGQPFFAGYDPAVWLTDLKPAFTNRFPLDPAPGDVPLVPTVAVPVH